MTTRTVDMPDLSGEAGPFTAFFRGLDGSLLNAGGDVVAEIGLSGRFTLDVSESLAGVFSARVYEGTSEDPDTIVWSGWSKSGQTELQSEYPSDVVFTGSGPIAVTITVNDGAAPLQSADVRLTSGSTVFQGSTNASGVVSFSVPAATYTVSIGRIGYTFASVSLLLALLLPEPFFWT